jgi:hypothetical protein
LGKLERRVGLELEPIAEPTAAVHLGGAPLKPVMRVDDARQLQVVIDLEQANGHEVNKAQLAGRFGVSRGRIRQALTMREAGRDLFVSPPELRTVTNSTGFVYWEPLENPRQH